MCGRFALFIDLSTLIHFFGLMESSLDQLPMRYNIAPAQDVAAVRVVDGQRQLSLLHWGLIPFWAKDSKIAYNTINARSETASKAPSYRAAFRSRRCLIPGNGFFEWDKISGSKQPYFIDRADGDPMAFAGLWETWHDKEANTVIESCTILTTEAAEPVASIHPRMPVILEPEDFEAWLDPNEHHVERLQALLLPAALGVLELHPVSRYVNKATNDDPRCIEHVDLER